MPELSILYLQGNSINKNILHYRKTLIVNIANLRYLDEYPVFDEERRFALVNFLCKLINSY